MNLLYYNKRSNFIIRGCDCMEYIANKEMVVIFDKRMGLETISSKLALLSAEQIKKFFTERSTKIPRKINSMALTSALNQRIVTLDSHSLTKDAFAKLESYDKFSEFQLQKLFEKIGTEDDYFLYRKNLWKIIIRNYKGLNLQDGEISRLINMKKHQVEDFITYSKVIFECSLDQPKEFDAYPMNEFEALLNTSFSQDEIRLLGAKYGFEIPARFKKDDLLLFVKDMMKAKRKLTLTLQRELNEMTVTQLNEFCTLQELGISSAMKKEELIALFLFLVKRAKFAHLEAKSIVAPDFVKPLKFRVDLDAVDNFKRGIPKKVIYSEADEINAINELALENQEKEDEHKNAQDKMMAEIIKKLLPYLNIDEKTAQLAIKNGVKLPEQKKVVKVNNSKKKH